MSTLFFLMLPEELVPDSVYHLHQPNGHNDYIESISLQEELGDLTFWCVRRVFHSRFSHGVSSTLTSKPILSAKPKAAKCSLIKSTFVAAIGGSP
mmetsp:Transcript_11964/g.27690  ORF Transcript_11964/g.27690 Transcript_11964/m.27690 type:complete len:95 (-) Transcript_11964:259-543(-)